MVKKLLIGGLVIGGGVLLYMKFFKRNEPTVVKWEDLDEETVREKSKQMRRVIHRGFIQQHQVLPDTSSSYIKS